MVILVFGASSLRVPHPFATRVQALSFDLHVLGMPPAFILSQDQTLHKNGNHLYKYRWFSLKLFILKVILFYSVFKDHTQTPKIWVSA